MTASMTDKVEVGDVGWYLKEDFSVDKGDPQKGDPVEKVVANDLMDLGVRIWKLSGEEEDSTLEAIKEKFGFRYSDIVTCNPTCLTAEKEKEFYTEHIHDDPEVRYFLEGSAFFDIRDKRDRWIRLHGTKGSLILLPAGIYHRLAIPKGTEARVMRLFRDNPRWYAINRGAGAEEHPARLEYEKMLGLVAARE